MERRRWSRYTVQPFLNVHVGVINGTLEQDFRKWHRNFRPYRRRCVSTPQLFMLSLASDASVATPASLKPSVLRPARWASVPIAEISVAFLEHFGLVMFRGRLRPLTCPCPPRAVNADTRAACSWRTPHTRTLIYIRA
jgi:hypothetical protein